MEQTPQYETHGKIIRRVPKTKANIYGAIPVTDIPVDEPCIVAIGGELTTMIKDANYYASLLEKLVTFYNIKNFNIYAVYYDFGRQYDVRKTERENAFIAARSKILNKNSEITPVNTKYIDDLYDVIIRPRIVDKNGEKLSDNAALQNMRNLIIYTHCHGSVPVRAFQDTMSKQLRELRYSARATYNIMKNLLVIQHAPVSPLEKSKFNTVSFMSANDTAMNFHNKFSEYVAEHDEDLLPSYFPLGNFFVTHAFTHQYIAEHQITGLVPDKYQDMLTPDGAIIMAAERNAIVNGVLSAQRGAPIPGIRDLIASVSTKDVVKPDFDTLAQNGEFFMHIMRKDLRLDRSNKR